MLCVHKSSAASFVNSCRFWPGRSPAGLCARAVCGQEEEARLKAGTLKAVAFAVMKQRGSAAPVSAEDIVRITTTDGTRIDWPDKTKRTLANVSSCGSQFVGHLHVSILQPVTYAGTCTATEYCCSLCVSCCHKLCRPNSDPSHACQPICPSVRRPARQSLTRRLVTSA